MLWIMFIEKLLYLAFSTTVSHTVDIQWLTEQLNIQGSPASYIHISFLL